MPDECSSLSKWIADQSGIAEGQFQLTPLAGDASFRRYFRLSHGSQRCVAVHAPPATEDNLSFLKIQEFLEENCIRAPAIKAHNLEFGYLLLEDLGDTQLYDRLTDHKCFEKALDLLLNFALLDIVDIHIPVYSSETLEFELNIFPEWFLVRLLGLKLEIGERDLIEAVFQLLIKNAQEQPQVFSHRDLHSRNIMCLSDGACAVIDFQDAVIGPITYDFVSLTKDCYVRRSPAEVDKFALEFREKLVQRNLLSKDKNASKFIEWVDFMGLQRHLKVLGIFSRLHLRDGKHSYLTHLPLVIDYVLETILRYGGSDPIISEFNYWFEYTVRPVIARQSWIQSN